MCLSHYNICTIHSNIFPTFFWYFTITTDPEIKSNSFWHIFENRAQNPENQLTSKCCRNRASWRIPSKPSPNERSRFSFSKKNIFVDFSMFYTYLNIDQIRIFEKVEKSQIYYDFKSLRLFQKLFFSNFFFTNFFQSI